MPRISQNETGLFYFLSSPLTTVVKQQTTTNEKERKSLRQIQAKEE